VFEATHGTAPKYADKDVINPSSVMLSGAMMFEFLGWGEAAQTHRGWHRAHHSAEARDLRPGTPDAWSDQSGYVCVRVSDY